MSRESGCVVMASEVDQIIPPDAETTWSEDATSNLSTHLPGISQDQMISSYNTWAKKGTYEKDLCPGKTYNGPEYVAVATARHLGAGASDARIIDIAAGTGLVGLKLNELGFRNIDALEPAEKMIALAEERGIYRNLFCELFAPGETSLADDTYDALVISGGMGEGHIRTNALAEMIRIVKPDGLVFIMMREEYLEKVADYKDRLEPFMTGLQKAGAWQLVERTVKPRYSFQNNGVLFVFRVTMNGKPETDIPETPTTTVLE